MTSTYTQTYTETDIEIVTRRFMADLLMIAQSSGALSDDQARDYAHDVEILAKEGALRFVDLTLLSGTREIEAARYTVDDSGSHLSMSRPGGVMWPKVYDHPVFRVVIRYTRKYDAAMKRRLSNRLRIHWVPTNADIEHSSLAQVGTRDYSSNGWAMQRQDYRAI